MSYMSTKTFGHELGMSCAFRQWRAESHCRFVHGYAIAVKLTFEASELDFRNWVVDFGSLKGLRAMLEDTFDHKTIIAEDDPDLALFERMSDAGVMSLVILPAVGCEKFAEYVFGATETWLQSNGYSPRCKLVSVEVCEHGANSAIYTGEG